MVWYYGTVPRPVWYHTKAGSMVLTRFPIYLYLSLSTYLYLSLSLSIHLYLHKGARLLLLAIAHRLVDEGFVNVPELHVEDQVRPGEGEG